MTREEAIKILNDEEIAYLVGKFHGGKEALDLAIAALSPVSREQVEKVWRGEWIPAESDFDDDDTLFDVEDWCDWQCSSCHNEICYGDPMERRWLPKFCPNCGTPMTDEAVQMVMERLEGMEDGKGD